MNWSDLAKSLPAGAGLLANILAPGSGPLVASAGAMIAHLFGVEPTPEAVSAAIAADPAAEAKLLELQETNKAAFQQAIIQRDIVEMQETTKQQVAAYGDVANARDSNVKIIQVTGHNYRADVLAYGAMLAFVGAIIALSFVPLPALSHDALLLMLGCLISVVKDVYGFEFGASQSDKSGDGKAALKQLADQQPPPTPAGTPIATTSS